MSNQESAAGYVYLVINYSMPGLAKVGRTARATADRVAELSSATGVPSPFHLVFDVLVPDAEAAESAIHGALEARGFRHGEDREFFKAPLHEIVKLMLQVRDGMQSSSVAPSLQTGADDVDWEEFDGELDSLCRKAAETCVHAGEGSTSLLERKLKIGYGRAARIIDQLHHSGVLGPSDGSRPRTVLVSMQSLKGLFP